MRNYINLRDVVGERLEKCGGGQERHFTEVAVMIAFAMYLLKSGAESIELHPDGEHGKQHDIKATLEALGFQHLEVRGATIYEASTRAAHKP